MRTDEIEDNVIQMVRRVEVLTPTQVATMSAAAKLRIMQQAEFNLPIIRR